MSNAALVGGAVAAAVLACAGLLAIGVGSGLLEVRRSSDAVNTRPLPEPPRDGSAGIVLAKQTEPHSILGVFSWGREAQAITVQLVVPPACARLLEERGVTPEGSRECPDILAGGAYAGGGVTRNGDSTVAIRIHVSGACFDAISYGDRWPNPSARCAQGS